MSFHWSILVGPELTNEMTWGSAPSFHANFHTYCVCVSHRRSPCGVKRRPVITSHIGGLYEVGNLGI